MFMCFAEVLCFWDCTGTFMGQMCQQEGTDVVKWEASNVILGLFILLFWKSQSYFM